MINSLLTERAVLRIFCYVQQEDVEDEEGDDSQSEMVYSEFLEAMAACAATLYPGITIVIVKIINIFIYYYSSFVIFRIFE